MARVGMLDAYSAPIVGAANTIMQGVDYMEGMKAREEEKAWTEEVRRRQRQQWEYQDEDRAWTEESRGHTREAWEEEAETKENRKQLDELMASLISSSGALGDAGRMGGFTLDKINRDPELSARFKQLDPSMQVEAYKQALDMDYQKFRYSNAAMQHRASKARLRFDEGAQLAQRAFFLADQGDIQGAAQTAIEAYKRFPDGSKVVIDTEGNVMSHNAVTGRTTDLKMNINNPEDVRRAVSKLAMFYANPQEYIKQSMYNSEIIARENKEKLKNPIELMDENGTVLYRVDLINPDTNEIEPKYYTSWPPKSMKDPGIELSPKDRERFKPPDVQQHVRYQEKHRREMDKEGQPVKPTDSKMITEMVARTCDIAGIPDTQQQVIAAAVETLVSKGYGVNQAIASVLEINKDEILANVPEEDKESVWGRMLKFVWNTGAAGLALPMEVGKRLGNSSGKSPARPKGGALEGATSQAATPPPGMPPDARQNPKDGKWYVERDGKYYRVEE